MRLNIYVKNLRYVMNCWDRDIAQTAKYRLHIYSLIRKLAIDLEPMAFLDKDFYAEIKKTFDILSKYNGLSDTPIANNFYHNVYKGYVDKTIQQISSYFSI